MMTRQPFQLIQCPLEGTNLIEASAGTGKTYTICSLYARLILEKELDISNILVVTYTGAATEELRDRIRNVLHDMYILYSSCLKSPGHPLDAYDSWMIEMLTQCPTSPKRLQRLDMAIRNFDEAAIYTIHSFCHRVLLENAFESGVIFDAELLSDTSHLIQEIADDFFRQHLYEANPLFLQYARKNTQTPDTLREWINYIITAPFLKLSPDITCPSEEVISDLENNYTAYYEQTKAIFKSEYQSILEALTNHQGINRSKYRDDRVEKWLYQLKNYFSDVPVPRLPHENLERFQQISINNGTKKNYESPEHIFFEFCEMLMNTSSQLLDVYETKMTYIKKEFMQQAQSILFEKKKKLQIQSFDDLLHYVYKALSGDVDSPLAKVIRNKYHAALIDEFQDTDPIQYHIFYTVFSHPECVLYIIGDPKQAIYSFRGADLFAYLNGVENADNQYTLDTNWRSSPSLVDSINLLFFRHNAPFVYENMPYQWVSSALPDIRMTIGTDKIPQPPLQILYLESPEGNESTIPKTHARDFIYKIVSEHIDQLLILASRNEATIDNQPVRPGDIAILVRTNFEARNIQLALQSVDIPGVLYSKERVWESQICSDISHVIAAVADYQNEQKLKSALTSMLIAMNADQLINAISDSSQWDKWVTRFQEYHELWIQKGFMVMFRLLLSREKVRSQILSLQNGERLLTDVLHIAELLHQVETEKKPGMSGLLEYFNRYRTGLQRTKDEAHIRLETDENAVKIVTIHKSKGLQYKIVYCPFLWNGSRLKTKNPFVFHDPDQNNLLTLPLTKQSQQDCLDLAEKEYLAENMRLLYVALTRAQYQCFVVHGHINKASTSPLSWLLHGKDLIQDQQVPTDIVHRLEQYMAGKQSVSALQELVEASKEKINLSFNSWPLPDTPLHTDLKHSKSISEEHVLSCLKSHKTIDARWQITSFSALTSNKTHASEIPDHDTFVPTSSDNIPHTEKEPKALSIFSFPKGAQPGTFMHELLENIDYEQSEMTAIDALISEKLSEYGFDLKWHPTIQHMIHRVRHAQLSSEDEHFCLCHIPKKDQIHELGFYFPITELQPNEIKAIMETIPWVRRGRYQLQALNFKQLKGMMKGFVDLIFCYKKKYYIVDWKSNYLGPELKYYNQPSMKHAIIDHYYILQYYIYTIALHRYLNQRLPGYDYDVHFGGVFYIFLRGLDQKNSGNYGIFRDRPDGKTIHSLDQFFQTGSRFFFEQSQFLSQKGFDFY